MSFDQLFDFLAGCQHWLDLQTGHQTDVVKSIEIKSIAGGHVQRAIGLGNRDQPFAIDQLRGQRPQRLSVDRDIGQAHQRQVQLLGHDFEQLTLSQKAQLHDGPVQPQLFGFVQSSRFVQLLGRQQPFVQQYLSDTHSSAMRCCRDSSCTGSISSIG